MREIRTTWSQATMGSGTTVMNFDESTPVATQRAALGTFWNAVDSTLAGSVTWTVEVEGRERDPQGTLTGSWTETTPQTGSAAAGSIVPNASQALIRWRTGVVVNGRFVLGHTYIPCLSNANASNGELNPAALTTILNAATALIGSGAGLLVWHRPTVTSGIGIEVPVQTAGVWSELAVQRNRRS